MSTPPSLGTILNEILNAIQTILYEIAHAVSENASVIATALVLGGLVYAFVRYGSTWFRGITGWFRTLV